MLFSIQPSRSYWTFFNYWHLEVLTYIYNSNVSQIILEPDQLDNGIPRTQDKILSHQPSHWSNKRCSKVQLLSPRTSFKQLIIVSFVILKPIMNTLFWFWKLLFPLQRSFHELKVVLVIPLVITLQPLQKMKKKQNSRTCFAQNMHLKIAPWNRMVQFCLKKDISCFRFYPTSNNFLPW
jgi:hypothetical protein